MAALFAADVFEVEQLATILAFEQFHAGIPSKMTGA
jgi:hypothetical protein